MASKKPPTKPEKPADTPRRRPPATIDLSATEVRVEDIHAQDVRAQDVPLAETVEPAVPASAVDEIKPEQDSPVQDTHAHELPAVIEPVGQAAFYTTLVTPEEEKALYEESIGAPPNVPPEFDPPRSDPPAEPPRAEFSPPPPPPSSPAPPPRAGFPWAVAAAASAIGALVIFLGLFFAGAIQTQSPSANTADTSELTARLAKLEAQLPARGDQQASERKSLDDIGARIGKIETALAAPPAPAVDPATKSRLDALEVTVKSIGDTASGITSRSSEIADTAREARERSEANAKTLAEVKAAVDQLHGDALAKSDLDKVTDRISAVESSTRTVEQKIETPGSTAADRDVRIAVLASALKGTVERGAPFAAELAAIKPLLSDATVATPLELFAAGGVPSAAALSAEFVLLQPALEAGVQPTASSGGILDRLQASASRLVRVRPINETPGTDSVSILDRAEAKSLRGDVAGVADELSNLPADARAPADGWIARAKARNAALAAAQQISADALNALAKPAH